MAPSSPRPPRRSPTTWRSCWHSTTTRATLGAPAHHQPDRVDLRDGQAPDQDHQGPGLAGGRTGDGVQADRVSPRPLARRQRTPPRRARARRGNLHQRQTRRTARREHRAGSGLNDLDPQVLTIALGLTRYCWWLCARAHYAVDNSVSNTDVGKV